MAGPTGVAFASAQTEVGIAIETTRGTAVAPAFWVPVEKPQYKPNLTMIPDETLQGSMVQVYDEIRGLRYDAHGWNAPPYLDSLPVFVRCELGSPDTVGVAVGGLYPHSFSLLNNSLTGNQPPSATITDFDGEEWRQLTGCQLDELTIKGNGTTLVDYVCTWFGNPATTPAAPVPSYTGTETPAPWAVVVSLGGVAVSTVIDWEFDFKRGVKPIPALTGTEAYFEYFADVLQAKGKLTFVEQSGSPYLVDFLAGTRIALDVTVTDLVTQSSLHIHSSKAQYVTGAVDRSKEWVEVPVDFQLLPTAADALAGGVSPVLITVNNLQSTAY